MLYKLMHIMLNKVIFIFLIFLMLVGCASEMLKKDSTNNSLNYQFVELEYYDSEVFDYNLSNMLKNRTKQVKLIILSPININSIPQRLDKWFTFINHYGGKIELDIDPNFPRSKGLITETIDLLLMTYESIKESTFYSSVENYDIKVFYIEGKGIITKILFTYRLNNEY